MRPEAEPTGEGDYRFTEDLDVSIDRAPVVRASVTPDGLKLAASYRAHVPYFWWIFDGLTRGSVQEAMVHLAKLVEAEATGAEPPPRPKRPYWAPPAEMTANQIRVIATLSFALAIVQYGGSLLTQTIDFVATTFGASNAQLGVVTALTRFGALVALVGSALADRFGRRRIILWSIGLVCVSTLASAAAPNLASFGVLQVLVRGGLNLAFGVALIAATEDAPERARTYTIAVVGIASTLGFVLGALLLPFADIAAGAWRGMYALGGIGLLFLPSISRTLTETTRFTTLASRVRSTERGRIRQVVDRTYRWRFAVLAGTGFLLNMFFAPESQFTNRFLGDERGFSGAGILLLRAVTQAVPAFIAAYAGGKMAETRGRRPVARWGLIVTAVSTAAFFTSGGPVLWVALTFSTASGAMAGPSITSFGTELFPTEVRGTAGAGLTITAVLGSAAGLVLVGYLAEPLGSIGGAVAVTCIAPLVVGVFLIRLLPEARGTVLDEVSPSEV